ncbi:thiol:disulfide oxidoreductase [Gluconacetobacter liquefaciens]|uniref:GST-like protein n=1 Tax=Gluconacetobacter liquefaciens TaxID=89584 RepID=A0A370FYU7_GLULI|nr:glutathione S-transferase N-terminal domain-containing protein [Gluconacetobacter liquefaciens]RDI35504.1 GST-like protein [Gluconacetobacter liquefaciens]GBR01311.1 glutathione S-transferase [Gluconacetobacter liquefaciens NRIC 0522]GEB39018.1 thiol:disulfide oxidoreductase [Gluconacetobacter liquefaciens]
MSGSFIRAAAEDARPLLEVHTFATPNSVKVSIALEELGLPYALHGINVRKGEQKTADFLALNPNGKVPVLVDRTLEDSPLVLTESAAILVYLAEKTGQLLPAGGDARARVFEQLFFHASGLSPAFGQSGFFQRFAAEPQPLAIERFSSEEKRTLGVLDGVLASRPFVAGDAFTIADIAHFGWLWRRAFAGVSLDDTPSVARWYEAIAARPAVQRGIARVEALVPQD